MKVVLSTTDHALLESARVALAAEGIGAIIKNEPGGSLPFLPATILVDDEDFLRAKHVLGELGP
jgi:hypothetical protein